MGILDGINSPSDLKNLPGGDLEKLAGELRETVIRTVSKRGGHLASSLGVVELTIAIHSVFNSPVDRIIWDVGHQAYAHKILTGRRESFDSLRQMGGISGFPRMGESEHDAFGTGHSSTSISAALGIAAARDMDGEDFNVVAVIGDGSLSSGIALEGLNQSGHLKKEMIVILNDNEWSISHNVGAISSYLNRIMTGKFYTGFRKRLEKFLKSIPYTGDMLAKVGRRLEELAKGLIVPGILFEELGFTYIGPIPGHNIEDLIITLQNAQNFDGPVLLHVITTKGKGYRFAEENPEKFHGVNPFQVETGKPRVGKGKRSYTSVFSDEMLAMGEENPDIVAITAAMPGGTGLEKFGAMYPQRFFDVGISESHGITFAAGLATRGKIPVAAIYSTFLQRAYDQIVHDVCLQGLHVVFMLDRGGIVGSDGATHQGIFDFSYLRHIPNMTVMAPSDEIELKKMIRLAISLDGPAAIRYPRGEVLGIIGRDQDYHISPGESRIMNRGEDVTIIAAGASVYPACDAAAMLSAEGIGAEVVDARFVKPLDLHTLCESLEKSGRLITVEENVLAGGFGSSVVEALADHGFTGIPVLRLGVNDIFVEHGTQVELREMLGIDGGGIFKNALRFVREGQPEKAGSDSPIKADVGKIFS